ncbi:MAG TPA: hypothetical protein VFN74_02875, partial [Chloroflexota bacterium]|nr:hypothetical protein [Chloroflexota bacterium]
MNAEKKPPQGDPAYDNVRKRWVIDRDGSDTPDFSVHAAERRLTAKPAKPARPAKAPAKQRSRGQNAAR